MQRGLVGSEMCIRDRYDSMNLIILQFDMMFYLHIVKDVTAKTSPCNIFNFKEIVRMLSDDSELFLKIICREFGYLLTLCQSSNKELLPNDLQSLVRVSFEWIKKIMETPETLLRELAIYNIEQNISLQTLI
eukprot:TRINITY_DN2595_c0_g1_i6.p2 TRINITY_DN2595_c0_g1~~TRINITY_DN2595_c0_g1_i6.p2  ORF type:complete len:132 (-),score=16.03 TRINITY_DN2595_c0_g1_i6:120-515(-)